MKNYIIKIYLFKKVVGGCYRISIILNTRRNSFDEALEAAKRYYNIACAEEEAIGDGWEIKEEV